MLSPLSRLMSATVLGLALLVLPSLINSSTATAYAGDSRRYDDDDHKDKYKDSKKYAKKKKKHDDDDDDRRWRDRRRFDDDWRWRNQRRITFWQWQFPHRYRR